MYVLNSCIRGRLPLPSAPQAPTRQQESPQTAPPAKEGCTLPCSRKPQSHTHYLSRKGGEVGDCIGRVSALGALLVPDNPTRVFSSGSCCIRCVPSPSTRSAFSHCSISMPCSVVGNIRILRCSIGFTNSLASLPLVPVHPSTLAVRICHYSDMAFAVYGMVGSRRLVGKVFAMRTLG